MPMNTVTRIIINRFIMCRSNKKPVLLTITLLTIFIVSLNWQYSNVILTAIKKDLHRIRTNRVSQGKLIDTAGCTLPKTLYFPAGFSMKKNAEPNCTFTSEKRIVVIDDVNEILKLTEGVRDFLTGDKQEPFCSVFEIHQHPTTNTFLNNNVTFQITETDTLDISDKEIIATKCGPSINFDAHFPLTEKVKHKIDSWNKDEINLWTHQNLTKETKPKPLSVLLLGFDSVSRSHFHRSLQKTIPLITEGLGLGFIDFKGYHSIAPNTLSNFYAFLMGLTDSQVRGSCAPNWESFFDTCPLIWNHFAANNYVTMYADDGEQSFNSGGQGRFSQKPTDYNPHPLFASIQNYRVAHSNQSRNDSCPYYSTVNTSNYLLDYTRRFVTKFTGVPFFSLTWFANLSNETIHSLNSFDEKLEEFFRFLNSEETRELRQNTLIILLSGHGERSAEFIRKGYYEGIIEQALPGLFIRLPEKLRRAYPEHDLVRTLTGNSERLTSGFDLHHTFLHLLHIYNLRNLDGNKNLSKTGADFAPVLRDRSSLFLPVSDQRSCADLNVAQENCMCTLNQNENQYLLSEFQNNHMLYTNLLVKFAIFELNTIIRKSKYRDVCGVHGKSVMSFHSWNVKEKTENHTDGVLVFLTDLDYAHFNVTLRVLHGNSNSTLDMGSIKRRGSFHRLNLYGDVNWCVGLETDEDKVINSLCHCKKKERFNSHHNFQK